MKISFSSIPLTLLVAFLFISPLTSAAQIPGLGIFFQAIARDKMDNPAKYRKIYIQTSIIESINSTGSYLTELHQSTTDANGIFNISIGQGKQTSGIANDLLSIPWSKGPLFLNLKIAIEPLTPLSNWDFTKEWIDLGTTPFGTVPYALSAGNTTTIPDINKVNIKDSNLIYATPYQLSLKTFDTSSLSNRINNKLNISDTSKMLSPYSKQNQVNSMLGLKLNISDTASMLKNYTISSKLSPLAFTGNYNDIINKPAAIVNIVNTVNSLTGDIIIDKNTIGLGYVDNTSDANKPISILTNDALTKKVDKSSINTANGIPSLDANTKIPSVLLPAISFTSVLVANSATQMQNIGTTSLKGTVVVRTDISKTYILSIDNSTSLNDWIEMLNPGAPVQSVNGKLANVSLTSSDIMEGSNEYFTQTKARLSISANTPINYNANSGLLSADTSTSNYGLVTRYALQQMNNTNTTYLNRKLNITDTASMLLPYAKTIAVNKYIDSVSDVLNSNIVASNNGIVIPDATISTKGIIKLAGDLSGTANAPIIADGVVTNNKIATGISPSKVGLGNVNNTADISKPISTLTKDALNLKLNTADTATMLSNYLTNMHTTNNALDTKLNKTDTAAMLRNYLNNMHITNNTLANKFNSSDSSIMLANYKNYQITLNNTKLNKADTTAMLSNYLTNMHTTKNALDTKLNKTDTTAMLGNYLTNIHTTKNELDTKLNKTDTTAMLSNYLTNIHTTKNALDTKLNKADTAAMLSNYLTNMHITKNALDTKLNKTDTTAMLSNYLTNIHTTKNALDTKELTANKSNDATLGGISPSATLYPTQSAVKQYIINNTGAGSISATNITGVVAIANGGTGQTTANAAFNAIAPSQTSNNGKYLTTNGTNTSWASIVTPWSVLGNAGMVDGTNFIGTTDAQPLNFKVNNTNAGRIDASNIIAQTSLGFGAASSTLKSNLYGIKNTAIGYQALNGTTYGKGNTAVGCQTLQNNTKGSGSTAIGYQALANFGTTDIANTDVFGYNTAIGYQALLGSSVIAANKGFLNVAVGYQALFSNDIGQSNIAIGNNNLYNNANGSFNVAIGDYVMSQNVNGSNNVAIGSNSFNANISGSNNTVIGYNISSSGYPNVTNSTAIGNGSYLADDNTITLGNYDIIRTITFGAFQTYNTTASTSKRTGSLIAYGGAGIAGDVNIGGYTNISGNMTTNGIGTFSNTTASTAINNGALVVTGGAGIGGSLNVGGNTAITGTATINGTATLNSISYGITPSTNDNSSKLATTAYVKNVIAGISTSTSSSSGWALTGNTGMVDGTNFIGTTDAQPLNFVANNINSGRIDVVALSGQTSFGYGSAVSTLKNTSNFYGTKNTSIGYQTLYNTVYGKENTAIGYQALYNNNTASGSTAIGYQAMYNAYNISTATAYSTSNTAVGYQALLGSSTPANNSGISNTAIGHYAERSNSSGSNNTGIGDLSLYYNTTGQSNTAIGYNTLSSITTGSSNTAIGYNADVTNNVSNATAIGNGATANTDNTIQLGNGSVTTVNTAAVYATSNTTESTNVYSGALIVSGGVGIAKNLYIGGSLYANEVAIKHVKGSSTVPTMVLGAGAGTITSFVANTGSDLGGNVTFKSGSGSTNANNAVVLTISFNNPYATIPFVVITPANNTTASITAAQAVYVIANTNGFSIYSNSTALTAANNNYSWNYIVVQ